MNCQKKLFCFVTWIALIIVLMGCSKLIPKHDPSVGNSNVPSWGDSYASESANLVDEGVDHAKSSDEQIDAGKAGFKSQDLLDAHYKKHVLVQGEFGDITKAQYLKGAQDLVSSKPVGNILTKTRSNGDVIFFNKATNEFAVADKYGNIRTYFKPDDGIKYFNRQT